MQFCPIFFIDIEMHKFFYKNGHKPGFHCDLDLKSTFYLLAHLSIYLLTC